MTRAPESRDFSMLVVNAGGALRITQHYDPPHRARVTTHTYGRGEQTYELDVVARSGSWLCVRQSAPGWPEWLAWVPVAHCTRI
ncbi:hypothetical protein ACFP63_08570 [Oerskovia jenensis]|uniref:Uncharacterized protein n=1 Tax=Oerskovia jenensis TaxID=162169 RepID=A0ABS2LJP4_9CELL|nr:hypothetical protein [Oerskovia jenensis]MBM7480104.1 hypothetical protein [Oerskovia jenensis]